MCHSVAAVAHVEVAESAAVCALWCFADVVGSLYVFIHRSYVQC